MSFLLAIGGASLALALQASGPQVNIETDEVAAVDTCIQQVPENSEELSREEMKAFIACIFQQTAMQMDSQLPIKIDETSTLVAVSASGPQFNYTYVLDVTASELPKGAAASIESGTRQDVCANPDMVSTMENGGAFFYRWLDRSGTPIHTALFSSC